MKNINQRKERTNKMIKENPYLRMKYNTKTNAIPSICASFESDVNVLANTGGKTDAIVEKLKLFVM